MKRLLLILLVSITAIPAVAQTTYEGETMADDIAASIQKLKYSFSPDGRSQWKPEFTARFGGGPFMDFWGVSGGVRINERATLGLMELQGNIFYDAYPAEVDWAGATIFHRRIYPFGHRNIVAFCNDLYAGAGFVYKVIGSEDYTYIGDDGKVYVEEGFHDLSKGSVLPLLGWQPTIRFRIYRNFQLFTGLCISTHTMGIVLGIGL